MALAPFVDSNTKVVKLLTEDFRRGVGDHGWAGCRAGVFDGRHGARCDPDALIWMRSRAWVRAWDGMVCADAAVTVDVEECAISQRQAGCACRETRIVLPFEFLISITRIVLAVPTILSCFSAIRDMIT